MAFDGIITKCVINELNKTIIDGKISKIFEPNKNEIILGIYSGGKNYALDICIDSSNCRLNLTTHTKPNPLKALNYCMLLRKHITGYRIKSITNTDLERIITIDLEGYNELNDLTNKKLIIELMGKHSNIILVNDKGFIIDSLRHLDKLENSNRDIMPAREYILPTSNKKSFLETNFDTFLNTINTSKNLSSCISSNYIGLSTAFVNSRLKNLNINSNTYSKEDLSSIYNDIKQILNNYEYLTCIDYNNENDKKDYVVSLNNKETHLDVNFYIDDFYYKKQNNELFKSYRNNILKLVLTYLNKYKKRLNNIDKKLKECDDKEIFQLYGELITSNLYRIKDTNSDSIQLENYYDNNTPISIPLNKKYSVSNNAKLYFKKYNKLKNALKICTKQKEDTELELNYIESIVYELESAKTLEDINIVYTEIQENEIFKSSFNKSKSNNTTKKDTKTSLVPIELNIDGYTILIGKNNVGNDTLTTKIANKADLWFHTKDIHGSHVILKLDKKQPTETIITKCAQIAAYHSKAKFSSNVPVDYCYVKYVKKPNKAKPGMVIYTHNKTMYVTPIEFPGKH